MSFSWPEVFKDSVNPRPRGPLPVDLARAPARIPSTPPTSAGTKSRSGAVRRERSLTSRGGRRACPTASPDTDFRRR